MTAFLYSPQATEVMASDHRRHLLARARVAALRREARDGCSSPAPAAVGLAGGAEVAGGEVDLAPRSWGVRERRPVPSLRC